MWLPELTLGRSPSFDWWHRNDAPPSAAAGSLCSDGFSDKPGEPSTGWNRDPGKASGSLPVACTGRTDVASEAGEHARFFLRRDLGSRWSSEGGGDLGRLNGNASAADMGLINIKLLFLPLLPSPWQVYAGRGIGIVVHSIEQVPATARRARPTGRRTPSGSCPAVSAWR